MPKKFTAQNMKRLPALLAAILLSAVVLELLFFVAGRARFAGDYPQIVFLSSDFTPCELILVSDSDTNRFETLANDSFFELPGVGGVRAATIDFHMSREPNDTTEMVVRFSGKSDGVRGVFTAGIKKIEPGLYRAAANFDSIESIRIYPTQITGATVYFSGIKLNPVVTAPRVSVSRMFLWAAVLAGTVRCVFVLAGKSRGKKDSSPWFSYYLYLSALTA
ncbi:MAG: hypothetical protein FWE66_04650, partial [Oscillospiraceae bacterium]|nr:hypothetical protein [Oscillospiraceae bacterium]